MSALNGKPKKDELKFERVPKKPPPKKVGRAD